MIVESLKLSRIHAKFFLIPLELKIIFMIVESLKLSRIHAKFFIKDKHLKNLSIAGGTFQCT